MQTDTRQSILTSESVAVVVETAPVICQRCKKPFEHFIHEKIKGIMQLRCGNVLITEAKANCLHCGWTFYWNIREKDVERMAQVYGRLVAPYMPE